MAENKEKLVLLIEAQNKDVMRKLSQIERASRNAFDNSRKPLKAFNQDMIKAASAARTLLAAFAGGLAIGGLATLPGAIRGIVAEASQIGKVADKIGLTTDELQKLRFGFELAGVAANQTDTAMQRFSRRVAQAANGSGELYEILRQNGVALREQDGSMRSQSAILRDYANLIQNAGSEQERLLLAFKAFDTEGAALVNGLKNGSAGLDELMGKAAAAGGVLEEELIRKAEEIDDEFAILWRNFEINSKSAILSSVAALSDLGDAINAVGMSIRDAMPAWMQERNAKSILRESLSGSLSGQRAINDGMFYRGDIGLPQSSPTEITVTKPTVIPNQERDKAAKAAGRQADSVMRVIEALKLEQRQIGLTATEQRVLNEISRAGAGATDAQKDQIRALVTEIETAEQSQRALNDVTQFFQGQAMSAFGAVTSQINTGNAALDRFLQTLIEATAQAAFFGQGPLASLFGGGGGGGLLGGVGKLFGGFFADGGHLGAGKYGIAGENGPELIKGPANVVPMGRANSAAAPTVVQIVPSDMFDAIVDGKVQRGAAVAAATAANDVARNFSSYQQRNQTNKGT